MTAREYLLEVEMIPRGIDAYARGASSLQARLLPGIRALCAIALANQQPSDNATVSRLRRANSAQLNAALEHEADFSVLRDILATQTWYELLCRGDDYKPRGLAAVAHVWSSFGAIEATP